MKLSTFKKEMQVSELEKKNCESVLIWGKNENIWICREKNLSVCILGEKIWMS